MSVVSIKEQQEQIKDWNQFSERKQNGYDAYREQIEDWNAYDQKQQQELKRAIDSGVPFDLMCSPLFSATAMHVLRLGMARGYDMEAYADPDWSDHEL
ncbi:hypothetical protein [Eubacterium aggregans]|uniref:hypothetical protein n=1 Tax=Eubacterium aggregans TaxID=81409 RepID=UPI003F3438D6